MGACERIGVVNVMSIRSRAAQLPPPRPRRLLVDLIRQLCAILLYGIARSDICGWGQEEFVQRLYRVRNYSYPPD